MERISIRSESCSPFGCSDEQTSSNLFILLTSVYNMRQDGAWGGNIELVAAARMYRWVLKSCFLYTIEMLPWAYSTILQTKHYSFLCRNGRIDDQPRM